LLSSCNHVNIFFKIIIISHQNIIYKDANTKSEKAKFSSFVNNFKL